MTAPKPEEREICNCGEDISSPIGRAVCAILHRVEKKHGTTVMYDAREIAREEITKAVQATPQPADVAEASKALQEFLDGPEKTLFTEKGRHYLQTLITAAQSPARCEAVGNEYCWKHDRPGKECQDAQGGGWTREEIIKVADNALWDNMWRMKGYNDARDAIVKALIAAGVVRVKEG